MKDKDKPRIPGGKKKHGDFSAFVKKKESPSKTAKKPGPSRSLKTSKLISDRFREEGEKNFDKKPTEYAPDKGKRRRTKKTSDYVIDGGLIRLNKYISHSGICSRREADNLIETGAVKVNGVVITELGTKVKPTDKVQIGSETLASETHRYVLLNKPKGYITTTDDPEKRNTVMMLVEKACKERIYPVGRLDRNTTGLLLFTNDGELAKKLTHPSNNIKKIYHVQLDQPVNSKHLEDITRGINLDDGIIKPDAIEYVGDGKDRTQIGIELHSGKNRIVRRIFESLGYKVIKLDRVFFAGLTKKDLPRGRYRSLTTEELNHLRMVK
ncbi:MAG: rRNA pseudouridine synthase [Bacteroidales bacterium]|nr:rRNA pseudouridine synthase [Bacteroidales bacterium]